MTDAERSELWRIVGWLQGIAPVLWLIPEDKIAGETIAEYGEKVDRLWELVKPCDQVK